jgi:hypothetical protein
MAGWYLFLSTQYEKVQSKQGYEREEIWLDVHEKYAFDWLPIQ